jgi:hypothetical protein
MKAGKMEREMILHRRLVQQQLIAPEFTTPEAVVAWLGAVQAQEYYGAKWSLGLRLPGVGDAAVEQAYAAGRILRTHILRPTWHFVTPDDLRWMMELTGPRVNQVNAGPYRELELDEALFAQSRRVIAQALAGGQALTRAELGQRLQAAGIVAEGRRLGYLLHRAELDLVVCSGPRRGKQLTYALVEARAPQAKSLPREEALARLALRYFTGHGPATEHDLARWSGLTLADVRAGIASLGTQLIQEEIDGTSYWSAAPRPLPDPRPTAFLMPVFDEFLVGYTSFGKALTGGRTLANNLVADPPLVLDGQTAGSWRRTLKAREVLVEIAPLAPLSSAHAEAVQAAAAAYGACLGLPAHVRFV